MQNQELYNLIKNSRLSQVARPTSRKLRGSSPVPTHQIIYTPKSSSIRSEFGIKTTLPKQIGFSHIVYNDIDNAKNMPDVEKYSGSYYNRLKFQESGLVLKNYFNDNNPLFPSESTQTISQLKNDSILNALNLSDGATSSEVKKILKDNPRIFKKFNKWLIENNPQSFMANIPSKKLLGLVKQFLNTEESIQKNTTTLQDFVAENRASSSQTPKIQGTGGFSYAQKGRLSNTPNGIKYGVVVPGRLVGDREAAIGGFVASVNDRTTLLQSNFSKNYPNKNSRQFKMPFKINEAEITDKGKIKLYADGIKVGSWMQRTNSSIDSYDRSKYEASNPNFRNASERNSKDNANLESLLNLINLSN